MEKNIPLTEALFYILLSVRKPNHGYGIIQEVEKLTGGRVVLGPGTLYGAIQTMTAKGWIHIYSEERESRRKKEYLITDLGLAVFEAERKRLAEMLQNAQLIQHVQLAQNIAAQTESGEQMETTEQMGEWGYDSI